MHCIILNPFNLLDIAVRSINIMTTLPFDGTSAKAKGSARKPHRPLAFVAIAAYLLPYYPRLHEPYLICLPVR